MAKHELNNICGMLDNLFKKNKKLIQWIKVLRLTSLPTSNQCICQSSCTKSIYKQVDSTGNQLL